MTKNTALYLDICDPPNNIGLGEHIRKISLQYINRQKLDL